MRLSIIGALSSILLLAACSQEDSATSGYANGVVTDPDHYAIDSSGYRAWNDTLGCGRPSFCKVDLRKQ